MAKKRKSKSPQNPAPRLLRVFVASPGDVHEERDIVSHVVDEQRMHFSEHYGVQLQVLRWETNTVPDVGSNAQDVINQQIGEYDVFVGILWKRLGTPTPRAESGTVEEFNRAYDLFGKFKRPKIMCYFRTESFYIRDLHALDEYRSVLVFKQRLSDELGVLYHEYGTLLEFERVVRIHLHNRAMDLSYP